MNEHSGIKVADATEPTIVDPADFAIVITRENKITLLLPHGSENDTESRVPNAFVLFVMLDSSPDPRAHQARTLLQDVADDMLAAIKPKD